MYQFSDILVFLCLFGNGCFFGYYCKYAYVYDNLWTHWYAVVGGAVAVTLAGGLTLRKFMQRQYRYDHFYMIFYGLICYVISSCFMLTDNLDICFYFGFIGLGTTLTPCYSYISLRSSANGIRPTRIAFGNMLYFSGFTVGFHIFNAFEAVFCGWIYMCICLCLLCGVIINEILQYFGLYNYKQSYDLAFNLLNEEKLVFLSPKSIYALFAGRDDFKVTQSKRQWIVMAVGAILWLERALIYSPTYQQLAWSSAFAYLLRQYLYGPYLLYTLGCAIGCILYLRYKTKLVYFMFGVIKITALSAILGVFDDEFTEQCFYFVCFYYISMGVYSSVALQLVLECTPLLYTELALSVGFVIELLGLELLKYETRFDNVWHQLLGIGILIILLTAVAVLLVLLFMPTSGGLIDMRNKLLGIVQKQPVLPAGNGMWNTDYFMFHGLQPNSVKCVKLDDNRVYQQYPREFEDMTESPIVFDRFASIGGVKRTYFLNK